METGPSAPPGILGSLRTLADGLFATLEDRLELISVELQEEKFRLIQLFVWISAAVFAGVLAITFASLTLVYFFWESARLAVLGGLAVFYTAAAVALILAVRRLIARQPTPFSASRQEIGSDRACIQKES